MQSGSWSLCMREKRRRAFHEPAVPERGSVTRGTWGCSDALRLTEPRSHRVVRFMVPMHAKKRKGAAHELPPRPRPRFGDLDSRMRTTTSRRTKRFISASRFTGQTTSNSHAAPPPRYLGRCEKQVKGLT